MKALSTTILIVVTALVILVVALVVLVIFTQGVGDANAFVAFKNNCITQCTLSCKIGSMPPTWDLVAYVPSLKKDTSCAKETSVNDCTGCGGASQTNQLCSNKPQNECTGSCQWCGAGTAYANRCVPAGQCNAVGT